MYNFDDQEEEEEAPPKEKLEENEQLKEKMKQLRGKMEKLTLTKKVWQTASQITCRFNHSVSLCEKIWFLIYLEGIFFQISFNLDNIFKSQWIWKLKYF